RSFDGQDAVHPVRRISPKDAATADSVDQVLKVPVKREPRDHRVEQMARRRAYERGGDAPRRAVEPDFAQALVHRGGEQQPKTLDAGGGTTNRARFDIGSRGEQVNGDEQVVRTHGCQVSTYEVRAFVREPVSEEGTAVVRGGRVARIDLHHDMSGSRERLG